MTGGAAAEPTGGEAERERPMTGGAAAEPTGGEAERERPMIGGRDVCGVPTGR
jgi:hypothetical protein